MFVDTVFQPEGECESCGDTNYVDGKKSTSFVFGAAFRLPSWNCRCIAAKSDTGNKASRNKLSDVLRGGHDNCANHHDGGTDLNRTDTTDGFNERDGDESPDCAGINDEQLKRIRSERKECNDAASLISRGIVLIEKFRQSDEIGH